MKDRIEIKWPWEMVWMEYVDDIIAQIKSALPPGHEMHEHDIFPGIKWDGRTKFIVNDDSTGYQIFIDFEKQKRWKNTQYKVPEMFVFTNNQELQQRIDEDHAAEVAKYK